MNKEIDGFIAARLQAALYREAMYINHDVEMFYFSFSEFDFMTNFQFSIGFISNFELIIRINRHIKLSGAASAETIDKAVMDGFGRRLNQIGPFQQADFAGNLSI